MGACSISNNTRLIGNLPRVLLATIATRRRKPLSSLSQHNSSALHRLTRGAQVNEVQEKINPFQMKNRGKSILK